jgi:hypothetical protein
MPRRLTAACRLVSETRSGNLAVETAHPKCFGYNSCMVALTNKSAILSPSPLRGRAQNHRYRLGAERCSKSSSRANLRGATYDECFWLGSCSKDPIGYVTGMSLYSYVSSRPLKHVDPSGYAPCLPRLTGLSHNPSKFTHLWEIRTASGNQLIHRGATRHFARATDLAAQMETAATVQAQSWGGKKHSLRVITTCTVSCTEFCDIGIACIQNPDNGGDKAGQKLIGELGVAQSWVATLNGSWGSVIFDSVAAYAIESVGLELNFDIGGGPLSGGATIVLPSIEKTYPDTTSHSLIYTWECTCKKFTPTQAPEAPTQLPGHYW